MLQCLEEQQRRAGKNPNRVGADFHRTKPKDDSDDWYCCVFVCVNVCVYETLYEIFTLVDLYKASISNINAIGFLFSTLRTTPFQYGKMHFNVLFMRGTDVTRSNTP